MKELLTDRSYYIHLEEKTSVIPLCWVEHKGPMGARISIYLVTGRSGRTKDFSYMLHTFTFSFPMDIFNQAKIQLEGFFKNIKS